MKLGRARAWPATSRPRSPSARWSATTTGEILLVQRADSGVWLYPTGWADVGLLAGRGGGQGGAGGDRHRCRAERLIAVLDGLRLGFTRIPLYSLVFHCRAVGGELQAHPLECADVGWFAEDDLPCPSPAPSGGAPRLRGHPGRARGGAVRPAPRPLWRGEA